MEIEDKQIEVRVKETLTKETCVDAIDGHFCYEREYDATEGRYVNTRYYETDPEKDYENECLYAHQCLQQCNKVLEALVAKGIYRVANIDLESLAIDCDGWELVEKEVSES